MKLERTITVDQSVPDESTEAKKSNSCLNYSYPKQLTLESWLKAQNWIPTIDKAIFASVYKPCSESLWKLG